MPSYELVPAELKAIPHWCVYRLVPDPKDPLKLRKPPFQSRDPYKGCSSTDPTQWSTYEEAVAAAADPQNKLDGIGWFFRPPFFGFDLDHVREGDQVEPWAEEFLKRYPTYAELSPSGTGFHGIGHGRVPTVDDPKNPLVKKPAQVKKGRVEVYGGERYFTVTGRRVGAEAQVNRFSPEELTELFKFAAAADPKLAIAQPPTPATTSTRTRLERFNLLSLGNWRELHPSQSEADLEYCCFLAEAHKGNAAAVERDFRASRLYRAPDQGKHPGYVRSTVDAALKRWEADPRKGQRKDSQVPAAPLVSLDVTDFMRENIKERKALVITQESQAPVIYEQSLSQLFAKRGAGKTFVAIALAGAMARGEKFLCWQATRPIKVMYVEGEMPAYQLQQRFKQLAGAVPPGQLRLITLDKQVDNYIPALESEVGQRLVEDALGDTEMLFLDSISTLVRIATNDEENWVSFLAWIMRLRSRGVAVMFLHHAGKGGLQRGHSRSEDNLDLSISLTHPTDYLVSEGLHVQLKFDKTRTFIPDGDDLDIRFSDAEGWISEFISTELQRKIRAVITETPKASDRKIAQELGCSNGLVSRYRRQMLTERPELAQDGLEF